LIVVISIPFDSKKAAPADNEVPHAGAADAEKVDTSQEVVGRSAAAVQRHTMV
jgi:hypothetical protein